MRPRRTRRPDERERRSELASHLATVAELRGRCGDEAGELAAEDESERLRSDLRGSPDA